ncbi:MAG TPA: pitrilysin family protein [Sedimentisphaerales bacterium]|nr:pitrilysin family protein [Sedimentisphaerales bacterium]
MEFRQTRLANGLQIIGEVNPDAVSAAVGFFVRAGARDETPQINGVSHYLEHMLFKGTHEISALEVSERFDQIGAKFNAFTSEENTVYYAAVLPEYLMEAAKLWCKLLRPALREDDFCIEKNVIKEEIAMYQDLPHFNVMDRARHLYFGEHPCNMSISGTVESIDALSVEQMREYFRSRYAPNNMVLACSGNFSFDELVALAQDMCGGWQTQSVDRRIADWPGRNVRERFEKPNLNREHICLLSPAVSAQDKRKFAAMLLASVVGDSVGSFYFWELVDPAVAETAVMHFDSMDGVGVFYSYISCAPQKYEIVMQKVRAILDSLSSNVTQENIDKARNKVLSALTIKNERPMGRLVDLGFDWTYLKEYVPVQDEINDIRAVRLADVRAVADEFRPGVFTEYCLGPSK